MANSEKKQRRPFFYKDEKGKWHRETPRDRAKKYAKELKSKKNHKGEDLNDAQYGMRIGYLAAMDDNIDEYYIHNPDKYREKYGEEKYKEKFGKKKSKSKPKNNKRKKETVQQNFYNQLGN